MPTDHGSARTGPASYFSPTGATIYRWNLVVSPQNPDTPSPRIAINQNCGIFLFFQILLLNYNNVRSSERRSAYSNITDMNARAFAACSQKVAQYNLHENS